MSGSSQSDDADGAAGALSVTVEEFRRRNSSALVIDVLYLATTGFLTILATHGFWPALIAALPLAAFLLFAWQSSRPFFVANVLTIGLAAVASVAGYVPL